LFICGGNWGAVSSEPEFDVSLSSTVERDENFPFGFFPFVTAIFVLIWELSSLSSSECSLASSSAILALPRSLEI